LVKRDAEPDVPVGVAIGFAQCLGQLRRRPEREQPGLTALDHSVGMLAEEAGVFGTFA
jgi:hypothetical protein